MSGKKQTEEEDRQGTDAVPITQVGTKLQENSSGGDGNHLGRHAGESFSWDPADKHRPNPQCPLGKGDVRKDQSN